LGLKVDVLFANREREGAKVYSLLRRQLTSRIAAFQPDIVHVMYGGIMAEIVTRNVTDRPVVVSFCGTDILGGAYFAYPRRLVVQYGVFASRVAARRADGIIVKSSNLAAALPKGIVDRNVWVIPNGVDLSVFRPLDRSAARDALGWKADGHHAAIAARSDHQRKRLGLARGAVANLRNDGMSIELHVMDNVAHRDVPTWLNASDVVLLTSIHEGSPNIVKEALACNRPVVSTDVGDVREQVQDLSGCFLARADASDLADKIRSALERTHSQGREKMAALSLELVADRVFDVYTTILRQSSRARKG
jgi:glycosyltransferase involved in cell wall biosynthesis